MTTATDLEFRPEESRQLPALLSLTRADLELSLSERVNEVLRCGDAMAVLQEYGIDLADSATWDLHRWASRGISFLSILDPDYPRLLTEVKEAPGILYYRGTLSPEEKGVSIVGSRSADDSTLLACYELSQALVRQGIPVISGLARGVDTAAHEGALDAGGRTVAVVGTGLDQTYPPENSLLQKRVEAEGGLVLSQFEPQSTVRKFNFPMRNAVMSGLGVATIVMAATENSGTKHQAHAAVKHGRKVIVTNRVRNTVAWANRLVEQGKAQEARSLDDAVMLAIEARKSRLEVPTLF